MDDLVQIFLHLCRRKATEHIIRTKCKNEDLQIVALQGPFDPFQSDPAGITGNAGVYDLVIIPIRIQFLLQQIWIRLVLFKAKTGREAVPKRDDPRLRGDVFRHNERLRIHVDLLGGGNRAC